MEVEYNGVHFQMAEIQSIHRETVWDDSHADLLYTRWTIGLVAFYSPNGFPPGTSVKELRKHEIDLSTVDTTATTNPFKKFVKWIKGRNAKPSPANLRLDTNDNRIAGGIIISDRPPGSGGATAGYGPILTDVTLRNRLLTPRGKLRIWGDDWSLPGDKLAYLIESPQDPYIVDPTGGPHPIALDILDGQDMGFSVFFQIETTVLPCDDQSDRLILSHRWQMSHVHDDNQYMTRVIDGEVVLNASMLATFGLQADILRNQLFHPIPLGCFRKVPHVTPSVNGSTYTYRIEDVDQTIVFDAGDSGAVHIEIAEKTGYYVPWLANAAGSAGRAGGSFFDKLGRWINPMNWF